ncbi:G-protein coupled receptor family C group 5 member D [Chanos chanos]|uniref:G-protein coupled receptor family C group 5 member D n=1 Tax=Chanos chanos TaxID=29144 RepID=A0A6J2WY58_CHACN|nr:G-protein coupled receptor family C group 5 member D-like [Chanos chanos]
MFQNSTDSNLTTVLMTTSSETTAGVGVTLSNPSTPSTAPPSNPTTASSSTRTPVAGCGPDLDPVYMYLCGKQAAWGIVVESLATLGFVVTAGLFLGLLFWSLWLCAPCRRRARRRIGGTVAALLLFLFATAGIFGLTFAFIIQLTAQTCPTRVFLFGVLFSLAFSTLLARSLALIGFGMARGWGEPGLALALWLVQVIIATEWLIVVLVRDGRECQYSQGEFAMLLIYVLCLLAVALLLALHFLCQTCVTYSYSYNGSTHRQTKAQAAMLFVTLILSACIWVVWISLLTRGNSEMGRRPLWDDPVLSIALVANGWVLLLGYGLMQVVFLCRSEARAKDRPLDFTGWTSPSGDIPQLQSPKGGRENGTFEYDEDKRGKREQPALRSPYESGFSMTEIDPDKDFSIPRPQTTNITEPYDDY